MTNDLVKRRSVSSIIQPPFYYGLIPWIWLRLTGYRDEHGRKAQCIHFKEDKTDGNG